MSTRNRSAFGGFAKHATPTFWWGMGATSLIIVWLMALGYSVSPTADQLALTWIASLTGYVFGIPVGMLVSPHRREGQNFRKVGGYLLTLASGFALSKLTSTEALKVVTNAVSSPLRSGRLMLLISFFVLGIVQTYFLRVYLDKTRQQDSLEDEHRHTAGPNTK